MKQQNRRSRKEKEEGTLSLSGKIGGPLFERGMNNTRKDSRRGDNLFCIGNAALWDKEESLLNESKCISLKMQIEKWVRDEKKQQQEAENTVTIVALKGTGMSWTEVLSKIAHRAPDCSGVRQSGEGNLVEPRNHSNCPHGKYRYQKGEVGEIAHYAKGGGGQKGKNGNRSKGVIALARWCSEVTTKKFLDGKIQMSECLYGVWKGG